MKRVDILIAVGLFLTLFFTRVALTVAGSHDSFLTLIDSFVAAAFGALLTLFQSRARVEQNIDAPTADRVSVSGNESTPAK